MTDKRVAVISPDGQFGTIDASHAEALTKAGGRVLTPADVKRRQLAEEYAKRSTAEKVGGVISSTVAGPIASNAIAASGAVAVQPEVEAFHQGVADPMTLGADRVLVKEALEATGGKAAGRAYAQHQKDIAEAHSGYRTAGEIAGFAAQAVGGNATGLARAAPGLGISAAGAAAEGLAARALGGVAARGILGRAAATGGEFAARGAVEGALYGAGQQVTEDLLGDHELAADKIFAAAGTGALFGGATGAAIGGSGSLIAGAAKATAGAAGRGLARVASRGEALATGARTLAEDASAKASAVVTEGRTALAEGATKAAARANDAIAEGARLAQGAAKEAAEAPGIRSVLSNPEGAAKKLSNELAFDALGATKLQARKALENVRGGAEAVGEYVNRIALKPAGEEAGALGGAFRAGSVGRADQLLDAIKADKYGRIAEGLSSAVKGTPARFDVGVLDAKASALYDAMLKDPTMVAGADAFKNRLQLEFGAVARSGKVVDAAGNVVTDGFRPGLTMDASEAFYLRAALEKGAYELGGTSTAAKTAYKQFLREFDDEVVKAIDVGAKEAGKDGAAEAIKQWKREWQLASAAEKAAEGGTERVKGNNIFGLREGIGAAVGLATGHPLGAMAGAFGGKVLRERGAAAGAFLLGRLADMGALSAAVRTIDEQVTRASRGLLSSPMKGLLPESIRTPTTAPRVRAEQAIRRVAEFEANPERFLDAVTRETEGVSKTAPNVSSLLTSRMVQAMTFLASKKPPGSDPDPFDPHPAPRLTDAQAAEFARYAWYVEQPSRFFEEVAHGKFTYEGAETARALMPKAFAELQERTAEALMTHLQSGKAKPPFQQRLVIDTMLDMQTLPSRRIEHMTSLQNNVTMPPSASPPPASAPRRGALKIPTQRSALDRLEADGPGRR